MANLNLNDFDNVFIMLFLKLGSIEVLFRRVVRKLQTYLGAGCDIDSKLCKLYENE